MKIPLSEMLDRLTIVEIKVEILERAAKDAAIRQKLDILKEQAQMLLDSVQEELGEAEDITREIFRLKPQLKYLNKAIFDGVDVVAKERHPVKVSRTAKEVIELNLKRSEVKNLIEAIVDSKVVDVKL